MIGMLQKEKQALLRSAGDDGNDVRDELQKLTNLLTEAEARLVAAKKSLEDDQKSTWELEDKVQKEKSTREASFFKGMVAVQAPVLGSRFMSAHWSSGMGTCKNGAEPAGARSYIHQMRPLFG